MARTIKVEIEITVDQEFESGNPVGPEYIEDVTVKVDGEEIEEEKHPFSDNTWTLWDNDANCQLAVCRNEY